MRKILIIGAGQSGLQLALGLRDHAYDVTVMSAYTPEEIRGGHVTSTQVMFDTALQHERDHGLNLWEEQAPKIDGLVLSVAGPDGNVALNWKGTLDRYAQSVDQRVKMSGWLELLERRGATVRYHTAAASELDPLTEYYDLVIVATGRGDLAQLFKRDPDRSPYTEPQRALAVSYVDGAKRRPEFPGVDVVRFNAVPGVGELFVIPAYTLCGPCLIPFIEAIPGGPMDAFADHPGPAEHWSRTLELMRQYVPWEYELFKDAELADAKGVLAGRFTPVVRRPVAALPGGGHVLGMADIVVANDPITGQGSNMASKCAVSYLDRIVRRGDQPFDPDWMAETFEGFWSHARYVTTWTNAMLQPPPEHVLNLFGAAATNPAIRDRFANGFDHPPDFFEWFMDPQLAEAYLQEVAAFSESR